MFYNNPHCVTAIPPRETRCLDLPEAPLGELVREENERERKRQLNLGLI